MQEVIADNDGRFLIIDILIDDTRFILVNVYAPTKNFETDQCDFIVSLYDKLQPYQGESIIIGGISILFLIQIKTKEEDKKMVQRNICKKFLICF